MDWASIGLGGRGAHIRPLYDTYRRGARGQKLVQWDLVVSHFSEQALDDLDDRDRWHSWLAILSSR